MATSLEDKLMNENAELRCYIERLRGNVDRMKHAIVDGLKGVDYGTSVYLNLVYSAEKALFETPAQSLANITEQLSCYEQALQELKAQVEEETIERCADIAAGTYEGTDYSEFNCVDFYGKCSAAAITVMPRKYTNQLEAGKLPTAKEKEDEQ